MAIATLQKWNVINRIGKECCYRVVVCNGADAWVVSAQRGVDPQLRHQFSSDWLFMDSELGVSSSRETRKTINVPIKPTLHDRIHGLSFADRVIRAGYEMRSWVEEQIARETTRETAQQELWDAVMERIGEQA